MHFKGSYPDPDAKKTTDDFLRIKIHDLIREGFLEQGTVFSLEIKFRGETTVIQGRTVDSQMYLRCNGQSQSIQIKTVPNVNNSGRRSWFVCPHCGYGAVNLYWDGLFLCRKCLNLCYQSQKQRPYYRDKQRAELLRKRLGWVPGILNPRGGRPRNMHTRTYERLVAEYDSVVEAILRRAYARYGP